MKKMIITGALAATLGACSAYDRADDRRVVGGALLGAGTGAVVGGLATGKAGGAVAGAAIGGVGGAVIGAATADRPRTRRICTGYDRDGERFRYRC